MECMFSLKCRCGHQDASILYEPKGKILCGIIQIVFSVVFPTIEDPNTLGTLYFEMTMNIEMREEKIFFNLFPMIHDMKEVWLSELDSGFEI